MTADSLLGSRQLAAYQQTITQLFRHHPLIATSAVGLAVGLPVISHVVRSYRGFLALGPGGIPYNFFGWCLQALAQPFARHDTRDPRPLANSRIFPRYAPHGRTSFLTAEVPVREGDRPTVPTYVAPQRQTTDHSEPACVDKMQKHLAALGEELSRPVRLGPSRLENPAFNALWIRDGSALPEYLAKSTKGEIAHVHPDGSSHLILSLADAETATAQGWAERHMLSGVRFPWTYVLIYAPRTDAEFEVWKQFVTASIAFTTADTK